MLVLISYDVSTEDAAGRKRLRQIAKQCVNYGQRVQNSVFECLLDAAQCKQLQHKLCSIMDKEKDSLRFYYLGNRYETKIEHFGVNAGYKPEEVLMICPCEVEALRRDPIGSHRKTGEQAEGERIISKNTLVGMRIVV